MTRTTRTRTVAAAGLAAVLLPALGTALLVWSFADRPDAVDRIPAAIVNEDEIVRGDTPMAAGRALSSALIHPEDGTTSLDWRLTSAQEAAEGLSDGTYDAVLTIPADFSADVLSAGGDDPQQARLVLETDPAASAVGGAASRAVARGAAESLGDQVTEAYLTQVYAGMDQVAGALDEASAGATELATGLDGLSTGAASAADGAADLATGSGTLAAGTGSVRTGASAVSSGVADLSTGTAAVAAGAADVSAAAGSLVDASGSLATGAQGVATALAQLSGTCPQASRSAEFCAQLAAAAGGAAAVADGGAELAAGATLLADGAGRVGTASTQTASGAADLASGAADLATGAAQAADGAAALGSGATSLAEGTAQLASGAATAASSSRALADGIATGAAQVPAVDEQDAEQLAAVVTDPVGVDEVATSEADGWLAATVTAVVLWLGAVTIALSGRRLRRGDLVAPVRTRRLLRRLLAPRALAAVVVTLACAATLVLGGATISSPAVFTALALLAAVACTLLAAGAVTALPRSGVLVLAGLTVVQLAAIGGLVPPETAPAPLAALNGLLPLGAFTDVAAALATGGSARSLGADLVVLLAWGAAGLALARTGVCRGRCVPALAAAPASTPGPAPVSPALPAPAA